MDEKEKQEILKRRMANRKLAEMIEQGPRYYESLKIRLADGQEHEVAVYAITTGEFRRFLEEYKLDPKDLQDTEKFAANLKFIEAVARLATGQDNIADIVLGNGCADIMMKCFEISNLRGEQSKKVESFQQGNIQPQPVRANSALRTTTE